MIMLTLIVFSLFVYVVIGLLEGDSPGNIVRIPLIGKILALLFPK